jgi:hypothetical protein
MLCRRGEVTASSVTVQEERNNEKDQCGVAREYMIGKLQSELRQEKVERKRSKRSWGQRKRSRVSTKKKS